MGQVYCKMLWVCCKVLKIKLFDYGLGAQAELSHMGLKLYFANIKLFVTKPIML
jgi:hypothetical protein